MEAALELAQVSLQAQAEQLLAQALQWLVEPARALLYQLTPLLLVFRLLTIRRRDRLLLFYLPL